MMCIVCNSRPAVLEGKYCSFRCRSAKTKKPKRERKPRSSGSKDRKARIRKMAREYSKDEWKSCVEAWEGKCAYCGKAGPLQQEHFFPVEAGGTYTKDNIIPACRRCNSTKHKKHPLEWLIEQKGGLATYVRIGSLQQLVSSIRDKLFVLPDDTIVAPGHNYGDTPKSTIGKEKVYNPYVGERAVY